MTERCRHDVICDQYDNRAEYCKESALMQEACGDAFNTIDEIFLLSEGASRQPVVSTFTAEEQVSKRRRTYVNSTEGTGLEQETDVFVSRSVRSSGFVAEEYFIRVAENIRSSDNLVNETRTVYYEIEKTVGGGVMGRVIVANLENERERVHRPITPYEIKDLQAVLDEALWSQIASDSRRAMME